MKLAAAPVGGLAAPNQRTPPVTGPPGSWPGLVVTTMDPFIDGNDHYRVSLFSPKLMYFMAGPPTCLRPASSLSVASCPDLGSGPQNNISTYHWIYGASQQHRIT